jgi:hypothetical protein
MPAEAVLLVASFEKDPVYSLTIPAGEGGSIAEGSTENSAYPAGTGIAAAALPNGGYHFTEWTAAGVTLSAEDKKKAELLPFAMPMNEDGTFRPDAAVTRVEFMALVNRMLSRDPALESDHLPSVVYWADNADREAWHYLDVQEASKTHEAVYDE